MSIRYTNLSVQREVIDSSDNSEYRLENQSKAEAEERGTEAEPVGRRGRRGGARDENEVGTEPASCHLEASCKAMACLRLAAP